MPVVQVWPVYLCLWWQFRPVLWPAVWWWRPWPGHAGLLPGTRPHPPNLRNRTSKATARGREPCAKSIGNFWNQTANVRRPGTALPAPPRGDKKPLTPAHCSAVQCSAVQCGAVRCSAVQCSAVQCSAVQCSAVQCGAVRRCAVPCAPRCARCCCCCTGFSTVDPRALLTTQGRGEKLIQMR